MNTLFGKVIFLTIFAFFLSDPHSVFSEDSYEVKKRIDDKLKYAWQQQFYDTPVVKVQSGDMLRLENGEMVCLIGIDTPEADDGGKIQYDSKLSRIPIAVLKVMGNEAPQFLKEMVEGRRVRIEFDEKVKDRYGNLLGYVFLLPEQHDGKEIFVNAEIIKKEYSCRVDTAPNLRYEKLFDEIHSGIKDESQIWEQWRNK